MIVFGTRHFGKVDEESDGTYVATQFVHIWFIPLIPLGSMRIVNESGNTVQGRKVPLSGKSILAAWLRFLCVIGALAGIAGILWNIGKIVDRGAKAFMVWNRDMQIWLPDVVGIAAVPACLILAPASIIAFKLSYNIFSPNRAKS